MIIVAGVKRSKVEDPNHSFRHRAQELELDMYVSTHFMEDFVETSLFACLQNSTRSKTGATRSPMKA